MWKDYCKGISNSENSANESVESVEHSIDCNENYLGLEMPMCSVVSLISLLQKLPLDKAPGLIVFLLSTCCMQVNLCFFLSELFNYVHCSRVGLRTQFLFKHNNSSHMQQQEWKYV